MKRQIGILIVLSALLAVLGSYIYKKEDAETITPAETPEVAESSSEVIVAAPPYAIGDAVRDFSLRNINGKMVSLASYPSARGFIIVFTCNHCPFSKSYEDRLLLLDKEFAFKGYPVIAINPNDPEAYEEDSFENMKLRSEEKKFTFPYLLDDRQVVARAFDAQRTPHVFLVKKEDGKNILKYAGAIDDNPQDANGVSKNYIQDALGYVIGNKPVVTPTSKAVGCAIKWKN
ncbi:redoxin domain-containing protein [Emticicia sp. CRIBPO]|uniref:thioredoxin family protein n=1 Tax=Emticicia sp. CRIBPO TaxID=2683258 RepID=UPI00141371FC|nr:thioredoxin family protein [Emticicia sp. CRIBPO]NBA86389.1 redoxin domain-containing protein [Emticicia sp. CRIBPO]